MRDKAIVYSIFVLWLFCSIGIVVFLFLILDINLLPNIISSCVLLIIPCIFLLVKTKKNIKIKHSSALSIILIVLYFVSIALAFCIPLNSFFKISNMYTEEYSGTITYYLTNASEEGMEKYLPEIAPEDNVLVYKHSSQSGLNGSFESIFVKWETTEDNYINQKNDSKYIGSSITQNNITIHHFYNNSWEVMLLFDDIDCSISWATFRKENYLKIDEIENMLKVYYNEIARQVSDSIS